MMTRLERIDPLSAGKVFALVHLVLALVFGILGSVLGLFTDWLSFGHKPISAEGFSVLSLLVINPVASALGGYITGLVVGGAYNFAASRLGGVRVSLGKAIGQDRDGEIAQLTGAGSVDPSGA